MPAVTRSNPQNNLTWDLSQFEIVSIFEINFQGQSFDQDSKIPSTHLVNFDARGVIGIKTLWLNPLLKYHREYPISVILFRKRIIRIGLPVYDEGICFVNYDCSGGV